MINDKYTFGETSHAVAFRRFCTSKARKKQSTCACISASRLQTVLLYRWQSPPVHSLELQTVLLYRWQSPPVHSWGAIQVNTTIDKFLFSTPRCTHFLDKLRAAQAVKKVPAFTETKGSLLFLQKPVNGRCPEPHVSKTHPHTLRP